MNNINIELMPFEKFVQTILKQLYHDETRMLKGSFKDKDGNNIFKETFEANIVGRGTAIETYEAYIKWFNYTRNPYEKERQVINAEWEIN